MREFRREVVFLSVFGEGKLRRHAVGTTLYEVLDFLFAFDDEAHSD